jgi:hypothetical protein
MEIDKLYQLRKDKDALTKLSGLMMLLVQEANKLFMIVHILNMDNIIVIGKLNVLDYIVQQVDQEEKKMIVHCFMEVQEFFQLDIIISQELFVMMALMIILLQLPASNYMEQAQQLYHTLVVMLATIKISGLMMLYVNKEWQA